MLMKMQPSPARRARVLAAACLVGAALIGQSGCGGGRSNRADAAPRPTARAQQRIVDHDAYAQLGYRLSWQGYPLMGPRGRTQYFDVLDDGVLVHSTNNVVTFVERTTGTNRWSRQVGPAIDHFVGSVAHNGRLLVSSDNDLFVMDVRTGEVVNKHDLAIVVSTRPVIVGPLAIFGSGSGEVLAHNLETGFKLWGYKLRGAIAADPVAMGELVGVVSQGGDVIIIDTTTGSSTLRARIFDGLDNSPVAGEDAMYVAGLDQSVYGFATRGDTWDWRVRTDRRLSEQPTLLDGVLYVDIPGEGLAAFDPSYNGERIWMSPQAAGRVVGMRDGDLIAFSARTSTAYVIDAENGDLIAAVQLPGVERMEMSPRVDGELFTITPTGAVSKFVPRS